MYYDNFFDALESVYNNPEDSYVSGFNVLEAWGSIINAKHENGSVDRMVGSIFNKSSQLREKGYSIENISIFLSSATAEKILAPVESCFPETPGMSLNHFKKFLGHNLYVFDNPLHYNFVVGYRNFRLYRVL